VLQSDGVGPFRFGAPGAEVVTQIAVPLGDPSSAETVDYPVAIDGRYARDASGEEVFAYPVGRTTCFANGLCLYSGGATASALAFVGWSFANRVPPTLATASGATSGSRWSAFPTMTVNEGGCFQDGTGSIDGVALKIRSEGAPFSSVDPAGNVVLGRPDPAAAVVVGLEAGQFPGFPAIDC
jgi:hypothetical protein